MKTLTPILILAFLVSACGDVSTDGETPERTASGKTIVSGKADDTKDDIDICVRYSLYDDGICDDECLEIDPDCTQGAPTSSGLDFLCELEVAGPNGYCFEICGDRDADCANAEADEEPICDEEYDNHDGQCDADCFPEDEDCIAEGDTCYSEYRYADGVCDSDCAFADPDCSDEPPSTSVLEDWQSETCEDLHRFGGPLVEIAYSICIDSSPSELPGCAAACLSLN